jgi:hypothetical protein
LAGIEDGDALANRTDGADVVAYEHDGNAFLLLQVAEQAEDLGLEGDVQCGGRLVGEEDFWLTGKGHGDDDSLPLAAAELVREFAGGGFGRRDADLVEKLDRALEGGVFRHAVVQNKRLTDLVTHLHHWVQAGERVLHHEGDLFAADLSEFLLGQADELATFELDGAAGDSARGNEHSHESEGSHGLSAAGLSDDAEGLACDEIEANATQNARRSERNFEITDFQNGHA